MALKIHIEKILCYHWRLGSDIKVLRLMFWFKDLVWDNKFIRQRIMLITHHDENVFSFQIYDVASTLFFCGNFLSFGQTCFQKILFFQIFLFKKKSKIWNIYSITMLNLYSVQPWVARI
jgi:hypothetical protein